MLPAIKRLFLAISAVVLVACGAPGPEPTPMAAVVERTDGAPGVLLLEAVQNVVLFDAPGGPGTKSYMLAGQSAEVLEISADGDWYRIDCWVMSACWVPVNVYPVRLVDATDNAVEPEPVVARLASTAPSLASLAQPTDDESALLRPPLLEPVKDADGPIRVNLEFDDAVEIHDTITLLTMDHYVLHCESGDELIVALNAADDVVDFAVVGLEDSRVYKELDEAQTSLRIQVTAPQDFMISVATSAPNADYDLYIGARHAAAALEPQRLRMDGGEASQIFGHLAGDQQDRFVLQGPADGLLSVSITSLDEQASFAVVGMKDGRTYKWLYDQLPNWSWRLPSEQDYMILVDTDGDAVPYSLSVALH